MDVATLNPPREAAIRRRPGAVLIVATVAAVIFVAGFALPYLTLDEARFGHFWPRRWWLVAHLSFGIIALLLAPVQIWLGTARRQMRVHRRLGWLFLAMIACSSLAAIGLIVQNDVSWVYGLGLTGLVAAWLTTAGFAFVAIRRRRIDLHREWMIRAAVVTYAFVWFRLVLGTTIALDIGTMNERFTLAAWSCWSVPLLVTEVVLQRKRLRAST
jgi:hypothetical protein